MRLNEVSQSKKIGQYVDASVFIKWYRENKNKIASILKVDENTLPDINEMLSQSYGLIKNVINTQSGGNRGDRTAFKSFEIFDKILIHDFLHNLYDVAEKDFIKSLTDFEFSIDELIEEIEILAIEESFMKYMNIRYPNRDFINQNINQLASYIVATFIKEYPEDFFKIISGEEEPFLPVQGKKMYLKGTPYEGMAVLMKKIPKSPYDLGSDYNKEFLEDKNDLYEFLRKIYAVSYTIDDTGGDRGQFPDGDYYGSNVDDIYYDDDNIEYFIDNAGDDYDFKEADEYYDIIKETIRNYFENEGEEVSEEEIEEYFGGEKEDENFPGLDFSYDDISSKDEYSKGGLNYYFFNTEDLSPIDANVRDILKSYGDNDYNYYEYLNEKDRKYNKGIFDSYYEKIKNIDPDILMDRIMGNSTSRALFRRFFRGTDLLRNVSKPTSGDRRSQNANLNLNNFFETPYPSLSKNLYTDNAKKLYTLLNEFRGYVIKNIGNIKSTYKQNVQLDKNFFDFFNNRNTQDYITSLTNIEYINNLTNEIKNYKMTVSFNSYYGPKSITTYINSVSSNTLKPIFEFIPTLTDFLNRYKNIIPQIDNDYLSQYVSVYRKNRNIKDAFNDQFIARLRVIYALLFNLVKKLEKYEPIKYTIIRDLEQIDFSLMKKTLNLKYKNNPPDEAYTKLISNSLNEIFGKHFFKPKNIEIDKDVSPNPDYSKIGFDGSKLIVRFNLRF